MATTTTFLTESLYQYLLDSSLRESSILVELRKATTKTGWAKMQIAPEQGQFMRLLVRLLGARHAIEIGTFTGYSSICIAQGLAQGGRLICCDTSAEWTAMAQEYWRRAGVMDLIQLRLGPAEQTLQSLIKEGERKKFNFIFIDADKENYRTYFECGMSLLAPGGLIAVDNTLWGGGVIDTSDQSSDTQAIREFNQFLYQDPRVDISMVPIGDGLTLICKK